MEQQRRLPRRAGSLPHEAYFAALRAENPYIQLLLLILKRRKQGSRLPLMSLIHWDGDKSEADLCLKVFRFCLMINSTTGWQGMGNCYFPCWLLRVQDWRRNCYFSLRALKCLTEAAPDVQTGYWFCKTQFGEIFPDDRVGWFVYLFIYFPPERIWCNIMLKFKCWMFCDVLCCLLYCDGIAYCILHKEHLRI